MTRDEAIKVGAAAIDPIAFATRDGGARAEYDKRQAKAIREATAALEAFERAGWVNMMPGTPLTTEEFAAHIYRMSARKSLSGEAEADT